MMIVVTHRVSDFFYIENTTKNVDFRKKFRDRKSKNKTLWKQNLINTIFRI